MPDTPETKVGARLDVSIDKRFLEPVVARTVVELGKDFEDALAEQIEAAVKSADLAGMVKEQVEQAAKDAVRHVIYKANLQNRMDEQALAQLAQLVRSGVRTSRIEGVMDRYRPNFERMRDMLVWDHPHLSQEQRERMQGIIQALLDAANPVDGDELEPAPDGGE